jgi:O-antigen/teichoic acid export membrane protein
VVTLTGAALPTEAPPQAVLKSVFASPAETTVRTPIAETSETAPPPSPHALAQPAFLEELRSLSRVSVLGYVGQAANALLAFAFAVVVGRVFHAPGTGVFFEAVAVFTIAGNVGDLGADDGLYWALPRLRATGRRSDLRKLLPLALVPVVGVSIVIALGLSVAAQPLAVLFAHGRHVGELASFIRVSAPFVPVMALVQVLVAGTRGFDRIWPLVGIWSAAVPALRLLLVTVLLLAGVGLVGIAYAWTVPVVFGAVALMWAFATFVSREPAGVPDDVTTSGWKLAGTFWRFSAPRALATVCNLGLTWLDILLVGYFISVRMAGIYGAANRYLIVIFFGLMAVGSTIAPQVSRLVASDRREELKRLYQTATAWVMAIGWPCSLGIAIFAPVFMRIFGAGFGKGATALAILALMMLYVTATGSNTVVLVMAGRSATSLGIAIVTLALNVVANIILIPRLGIDGAAWAWALSLLVSNVLINVVLYRDLGLHPFGPAFLPVAAASLLLVGVPAVVLRVALGAHVLSLVVAVLVGGVTYVVALWRLRHRLDLGVLVDRSSA